MNLNAYRKPTTLSPAEPFVVISKRDDFAPALPSMKTPIRDFIQIPVGTKGVCLYVIEGVFGMWSVMLEDGRQLLMDKENLRSAL